jgi:hypothetical protein
MSAASLSPKGRSLHRLMPSRIQQLVFCGGGHCWGCQPVRLQHMCSMVMPVLQEPWYCAQGSGAGICGNAL